MCVSCADLALFFVFLTKNFCFFSRVSKYEKHKLPMTTAYSPQQLPQQRRDFGWRDGRFLLFIARLSCHHNQPPHLPLLTRESEREHLPGFPLPAPPRFWFDLWPSFIWSRLWVLRSAAAVVSTPSAVDMPVTELLAEGDSDRSGTVGDACQDQAVVFRLDSLAWEAKWRINDQQMIGGDKGCKKMMHLSLAVLISYYTHEDFWQEEITLWWVNEILVQIQEFIYPALQSKMNRYIFHYDSCMFMERPHG